MGKLRISSKQNILDLIDALIQINSSINTDILALDAEILPQVHQ